MPGTTVSIPASVLKDFSRHRGAPASRFETSSSFREICADYDEVITNLARVEAANKLTGELQALARELEQEILAELDPAAED